MKKPPIPGSDVVPVAPYKKEMPYSINPELNAPRMKYLKPASTLRGSPRYNAQSTYIEMLMTSSATNTIIKSLAKHIRPMPQTPNSTSE